MPQGRIQTHQILERRPQRQHKIVGLHSPNTQHLDVGIYLQTAPKVQAWHNNTTPTLPIYLPTMTIWKQRSMIDSPRYIPPLSKDEIKHTQWVIGSILYYACAVDLAILMVLSTIASEQAHATKNSKNKTTPWLLGNSLGGNSEIPRIGHDIKHTHLICQRQLPTAEHMDTSLLNGNPVPHSPSNWMVHFSPCVQSCILLWRPPRWPNLGHCFSIANRQQFSNSRLKRWDIHNHRCQFTAIT